MEKRIIIHISSQKSAQNMSNSGSNFVATLPQALDLRGQWKMALSQIIFHSSIDMLPSLDFKLTIEDLETDQVTNITFPSQVSSCNDIVKHFEDSIKTVVEIKTRETGQLRLKFLKKIKLRIGAHLALLLGDSSHIRELVITNVEPKPNDDDKEAIQSTKNDVFVFNHSPRHSMTLYPSSIFIYSKELNYTMCGDHKSPILGIVPIPFSPPNKSHYHDIQIENPHFVRINNTELKSLHVYLCSHDNSLISFAEDNTVTYLTLILEKIL